MTEGQIQVTLWCGEQKGTIHTTVFPHMHKDIILGIPWLHQKNPHINWTWGSVVVRYTGKLVTLPLAIKTADSNTAVVTLISAKQIQRWIKHEGKEEEMQMFLGLIQRVREDKEQKKPNGLGVGEATPTELVQMFEGSF